MCVIEINLKNGMFFSGLGTVRGGGGFCVMNEAEWRSRGNYSEIVDCVISRMQIQFQSGIVMEQEIGNE